jgi:hypothetical protein
MSTASPPSANVITQIGPESPAFTLAAATHQLNGVYFVDTPKIDTFQFTPQGQQNPVESVRGKQWSELAVTADFPDFNGLTYLFASLLGVVSPTTHAGGTTSKDWKFIKSIVNAALGQTYTVERGSTVRARRYTGCVVDALTLSGTADELKISGHAWGQALSDAATLTPAIPLLNAIPLAGTSTTIYVDLTSGGIHTTKFVPADWSIAFSNFYGTWFGVDASAASYSDVVPLKPKMQVDLTVKNNATGMAFLGYLLAGTTIYCSIDVTGPVIESAINNEMRIDFALKLSAISAFGDNQGIETVKFTGVVATDIAWGSSPGTALTATMTNILTAL